MIAVRCNSYPNLRQNGGRCPTASAAVRRTQPSSRPGYYASIDNVPDRRIDIGIPRQRVFAR